MLLTSCFLHVGVIHILANMYALYSVGGEIERMVGVSALPGHLSSSPDWAAVAWRWDWRRAPRGRHLGGALRRPRGGGDVGAVQRPTPTAIGRPQLRRNLLINGVLITFISLTPNVNWQGHLGGAVIGAVVALVMQVQRFGPSPWRWAVLGLLVPLPWLGYAFIHYEQQTNPGMEAGPSGPNRRRRQADDRKSFEQTYIAESTRTRTTADELDQNEGGVLQQAPAKRDAAVKDRAKRDFDEARDGLSRLADDLSRAGPYEDDTAENARQVALEFVEAARDFTATAAKRLREGDEWKPEDEAKYTKMTELSRNWHKLLKQK